MERAVWEWHQDIGEQNQEKKRKTKNEAVMTKLLGPLDPSYMGQYILLVVLLCRLIWIGSLSISTLRVLTHNFFVPNSFIFLYLQSFSIGLIFIILVISTSEKEKIKPPQYPTLPFSYWLIVPSQSILPDLFHFRYGESHPLLETLWSLTWSLWHCTLQGFFLSP